MASNSQIKEHIATYAPLIRELAMKNGYLVCSPIIAQSITETVSKKDPSGWSVLKYKYHNFFGMKCGDAWLKAGKPGINLKTDEEYNGQKVSINDFFRVYDSDEAGIKGYFEFISSARYKNLKTATSPEQYLKYIKQDGYATSSSYYTTNIGHVNKYNLRQYDNFAKAIVIPVTQNAEPVLKYGMKDKDLDRNYIECWQTMLSIQGYNPGPIDGIFGVKTQSAVKAYQKNRGFKNSDITGEVDAKTWATIY